MNFYNYKSLSIKEILSILKHEKICQLSTTSDTNIETVPMYFIFEYFNEKLTFYFISFNNGTKMNNMKDTGIVCVSLNKTFKKYCCESYTSVIANGNATIIYDLPQKNYILNKFKHKYYSDFKNINCLDFDCIEVKISDITGRMYS